MDGMTIKKNATWDEKCDLASQVGIELSKQGADYAGCGGPTVYFGTPGRAGQCGFVLEYKHWDIPILVVGMMPRELRNSMYSLCHRLKTLTDVIQGMEEDMMSLFDVGNLVEAMLSSGKGSLDVDPC